MHNAFQTYVSHVWNQHGSHVRSALDLCTSWTSWRGRGELEVEIMEKVVAVLVVMVLVMEAMSAGGASADNYDPGQVAECMPTFNNEHALTTACCSKFLTQFSCLWQYLTSRVTPALRS
jgi:hypothetical protein